MGQNKNIWHKSVTTLLPTTSSHSTVHCFTQYVQVFRLNPTYFGRNRAGPNCNMVPVSDRGKQPSGQWSQSVRVHKVSGGAATSEHVKTHTHHTHTVTDALHFNWVMLMLWLSSLYTTLCPPVNMWHVVTKWTCWTCFCVMSSFTKELQ